MKLDATHRNWLLATATGTVLSAALYAVYAATTPGGPRGGTWIGLAFGVAGACMIFFAGLLGARKKMLLWRIGSVTWWMRGHLWLGILSLPMVLFHAGFAMGGALTTVLIVVLLVVVVSGVIGAAFQHALPSMLTAQVTEECTYEQLERSRLQLRREAYELVADACGPVEAVAQERADLERGLGLTLREPKNAASAEGSTVLSEVYATTVLPFMRRSQTDHSTLTDRAGSALLFEEMRPRLDPSLHQALDSLASICSVLREQRHQVRLHRWLHGWLLLHVPLSMALLVLMAAHVVTALYF